MMMAMLRRSFKEGGESWMASAMATAVAAKMAEIGGERGVDLVIRSLRRLEKPSTATVEADVGGLELSPAIGASVGGAGEERRRRKAEVRVVTLRSAPTKANDD